jgi:alpha-1,3-glucan synthase
MRISFVANGEVLQGIYLAGTVHINQPWAADSYSPLDLTLLDHHFGNITAWRETIDDIHSRGMYIIFDNTMSTYVEMRAVKGCPPG